MKNKIPRKTRKAFYKALKFKKLTLKEHKRVCKLIGYWTKDKT